LLNALYASNGPIDFEQIFGALTQQDDRPIFENLGRGSGIVFSMRIRSPSSRATPQIRFLIFDVIWAALSPLLALYIRDAYVLSYDGALTAGIYCLASLIFSLIAFAAFGIRDGMPRYFSVHDAIALAKAVLVGELMTCVVLFTFTRLEGIPRSTPVIHALILGAGLVTARALAHINNRNQKLANGHGHHASEHIILIGLSDLSSLYMKALEAFAAGRQRVIAVLDERPLSIGRSVNGVRVFGPPAHLQSLIEEFAVHGIRIDRVVVGGEADILSDGALKEIQRVCAQRNLDLEFVPRLFGFSPERITVETAHPELNLALHDDPEIAPAADVVLPSYFRFKPLMDFCVTLILLITLLPLWILVASLAFLDVGSPIFFWQQRTGLNGRNFLLHKFRTLQPPFDWTGQTVPEALRLSWIGRLLRKTRLDELPQLLNVLVGDMSVIGPRPLLPQDQPPTPSVRLMVRPGITGWAQVNGGTLLSPSEKEELDEWYIRNASLWLDLNILAMTLPSLFRGDRRSEHALAQARTWRSMQIDGERAEPKQSPPSPLPTIPSTPLLSDDDQPPAVRSW
jgi:lipopolysaccharide/colanic/teichoic acid biosynthesis glycosyltransferase